MKSKQIGEGISTTSSPQPKFYKIVLSTRDCTKLRIPENFASLHCENLQHPAYLEVPTGHIWEVEVVHSQGKIWLAKGWQEFSEYYSISCGHFLVFGYNGHSNFSVTILDLSASEIEYPCGTGQSTQTTISHDEEVHHAPKGDHPRSDDSNEDLDMVENLGHGSKRKRQERDIDDDSDDACIQQTEVEKLQEIIASPSFGAKKPRKRSRMNKQQPGDACDKNNREMDKKRAISYQRANAFKSNNPFILSFMQQSYVSYPFQLCIPKRIFEKYFKENCGNLVLRVPGRGSWPVKCYLRKENAKIYWKTFVLDNELRMGDACVFEMIKGTKQLINVIIFPAAGTIPRTISRTNKQQTQVAYAKSNREMDKEIAISYQRAKAFKSENPFVVFFMQPSYVSHRFQLGIPLRFAVKYFKENNGNLVLRVPGKGSWPVKCYFGKVDAKIYWKAFVLDNELRMGDACVFEVIKGTKQFLDVSIFPAAGTISGEISRTNKQQLQQIDYDKNTREMDKKKAISHQRAKAFNSKNPCIVLFMQQSYVSHPFQLTVPFRFAEKYFKENNGNLELYVPGRGPWPVKCALRNRNAQIHWKSFVLDNKLRMGDACVFEVIKCNKQFIDVSIFPAAETIPRKIGRTKKRQTQIAYDKNKREMDKKRAISYQRAKAFNSKNPFIVIFTRQSYVSYKFRLCITLKFAEKYFKENNGNLVLCVPGRGSWPVKCVLGKGTGQIYWKTFVLDNDIRMGDACVFEVIKGTKQFINVSIFPAAGTGPRTISRTNKQQTRVAYAKSKREMDKERAISYQRANAFKSENPFIVYFMQPSYVSHRFQLGIPFRFAEKYFKESNGNLVFRVPGKGSWPVKCYLGKVGCKVYWETFVLDNELRLGDACVFEVIEGTELLINVSIFPAAERIPKDYNLQSDDSIENLKHCPLGKGSKRKR